MNDGVAGLAEFHEAWGVVEGLGGFLAEAFEAVVQACQVRVEGAGELFEPARVGLCFEAGDRAFAVVGVEAHVVVLAAGQPKVGAEAALEPRCDLGLEREPEVGPDRRLDSLAATFDGRAAQRL